MLRQRSILAVAAAKRPRLIPPLVLGAFTLLVAVSLVLMFPFRVLMDQVLNDRRGDDLTLAYLHNLLRTEPGNLELALRLAQQQLERENFASMRLNLREALASEREQDRIAARVLLWKAAERQWRNEEPGSARRKDMERGVLSELAELAKLQLDELTQVEVAERALDLGDGALALRLFQTLGRNGTMFDADWFGERGRIMQGRGEQEAAMQLFMIARGRAVGVAARRAYFVATVRVLVAADRPANALELAEQQLGDLQSDLDSLIFMVELARSANRPDVAARYARAMLRLSLLEVLHQLVLGDASGARVRHVADRPAAAGEPGLPFDDRVYTLGYEAFLGNRDLDDAYRVAESAVRQAPQNTAWRRRLAQVAEWTARPEQALVHWRWLAEHGTGGGLERDEAVQALLRLAPGLFDDRALQIGLSYQVSRDPTDVRLLAALVDTYERLGEPEQGLAMLQRVVLAHPRREPMQALAELAERAARPELAIATLRQMDKRFGIALDRAMRLAALLIGQGAMGEAQTALLAARPLAGAGDVAFWRRLGALSMRLQEDASAVDAYSRLVRLESAALDDFDSLVSLLADDDPAQAGDLAMRAAQRFDSWPHVLRALDLYAQAGMPERSRRVFAGLDQRWHARAENDARFLALRAAYWRGQGRHASALADYQRWLALEPRNTDAREGLLWLLIDSHQIEALKALLATQEALWALDVRLHDALAAAWQTLSLPRNALVRYLSPRLAQHRGDFLWLMNYADALEQDQQGELAWRLRQKLWLERPRSAQANIVETARREAKARLLLSRSPGEHALAALRDVLRLDRAAGADKGGVADELALGWLLAQNESEAARGYLWARYAGQISRPQWAAIAVALANRDATAAGELLERRGSALPRHDAVSAAQLANAPALAADLAFESQSWQRDDEALQQQLQDVLLDQADQGGVELEQRSSDGWVEKELRLQSQTRLTPALHLWLDLGGMDRSVQRDLRQAPNERYAELALTQREGAYATRLGLGWRDSFAGWMPLSLSQTLAVHGTWDLNMLLGWRQPATESLTLRALGWRDVAGFDSTYRFSAEDRLALAWQGARYATQNGIGLGIGWRTDLSLSHSFRRETRESSAEIFWSHNRFNARSSLAASPALDSVAARIAGNGSAAERVAGLLPRGYDLYGVRWATETGLQRRYTRALRPYGSIALTYNSDSGAGFSIGAGLATSVFGADHLALGFSTEKGGGSMARRSTFFGVNYWMAY